MISIFQIKKSIYGLNQASHQWYLKFDQVISDFGFKAHVTFITKLKEVDLYFLCYMWIAFY